MCRDFTLWVPSRHQMGALTFWLQLIMSLTWVRLPGPMELVPLVSIRVKDQGNYDPI
jgi:hypothetical protein